MGINRITIVNWLGLGSGLILTLFLFFGFFGLRFGVIQTLYCWMISQVIMVSWGLWLNRKDWWPLRINDHFQPRLLKEMLRFGWQSGLAGLISFLNYRVDMLWIGATFRNDSSQLGIYSLAVGTAELIWWTSSSLSIAICARVGSAEHDEAAAIISKSVRHTLYLNLFLAVLMWPAVHLLLPVVYGEVYRPALEPFQILLPGTLAYGLASILAIYFTIQLGKPKFSVIISSLSMIISMVICYTMIPRIGINGGAWATTISYLVAITVMLIWFCRKSKTPLRELLLFKRSDLRDYYNMLGYFLRKGK